MPRSALPKFAPGHAPRPATQPSAAAGDVGELPGDVAAGVALGDVPAPVVELLAPGQADLDLGPPALVDVQPERDHRLALLLRLREELGQLGAVDEQLAGPLRLVVHPVAALV